MPTVPVGDVVFNVLTKALDVGTPAENGSAAETTGTWTSDVTFSPSRLQASFYILSARIGRRFDGHGLCIARKPFDGPVMDGLDAADHFQGTNGLLTGTTLGNHNVTDATTYALYRKPVCLRARGWSGTQACTEDIRVVMGPEAYAHAASVYRGNNDNMDALDGPEREPSAASRCRPMFPTKAQQAESDCPPGDAARLRGSCLGKCGLDS